MFTYFQLADQTDFIILPYFSSSFPFFCLSSVPNCLLFISKSLHHSLSCFLVPLQASPFHINSFLFFNYDSTSPKSIFLLLQPYPYIYAFNQSVLEGDYGEPRRPSASNGVGGIFAPRHRWRCNQNWHSEPLQRVSDTDGGFQCITDKQCLIFEEGHDYLAISMSQACDGMRHQQYSCQIVTRKEVPKSLGDIYTAAEYALCRRVKLPTTR